MVQPGPLALRLTSHYTKGVLMGRGYITTCVCGALSNKQSEFLFSFFSRFWENKEADFAACDLLLGKLVTI